MLRSPNLNVERVRLRVLRGGHNVPEDKVRSRYANSLAQLPWFLEAADRAHIFDNSGAVPKLVGLQDASGDVAIDPGRPAPLRAALTGLTFE